MVIFIVFVAWSSLKNLMIDVGFSLEKVKEKSSKMKEEDPPQSTVSLTSAGRSPPTLTPTKNNNEPPANCSLRRWESHNDNDDAPAVATATLEFECPSVWPVQGHGVGCCPKESGLLTYTSNNMLCHNNDSSQQYEDRLIRGSSLLKEKRLLFVGDSVGHHWLNVMLLAAYSKDSSLFPSNRSIWTESFNQPGYYEKDPEKDFCAFPMRSVNMSSVWPDAPVIASFLYPNEWCPPPYKKELYRQCCPGGNPISRTGPISFQLEEMRPNIVIVQMGVHWHTVPKFRADHSEMLSALANYSAAMTNSSSDSESSPLVLFLESLPQHFDAPAGDGSYDDFHAVQATRTPFQCFPLNQSLIEADLLLQDNSTSVGMHNFNRIAKKSVDQTPGVQWLTSNSRAYARRNDGHNGATRCCARHTDCTHFCYSPHLWQPAIDPFLLAVDHWN